MKSKNKRIFGLLAVAAVWAIMSAAAMMKPSDEISESERRRLMQKPEFTAENVINGSFMSQFENYATDQFPMRDSFRRMKSIAVFGVFMEKENNGIYIADGHAAKIEYPLNQSSVNSAVSKFSGIYEKYLSGTDANVYLSIVPDKHYFLAGKHGYPRPNYEKMIDTVRGGMDFAEYIDITDSLSIDDYYKTDPHWRQEKILNAADKIAQSMGIGGYVTGDYREITAKEDFYGAYYGQSALPLRSDSIKYLTNDTLENCTVYNAENDTTCGIYDTEKLDSRDPYEFFLSGSSPLLVITNPNAPTDRRLTVFRDSFGSSLVPLLAEGYSQITLIDTRYISSAALGEYVDFTDSDDVLFIYSTLLLNNSSTLR